MDASSICENNKHRTHKRNATAHSASICVLTRFSFVLSCVLFVSFSALKEGFAFVEFENERDAIDAVRGRDGSDFNGQRIRVEHSRPRTGPAGPMGMGGGRGMDARGPPKCFNCGQEGHMARDCKSGDWSNRCYVCKGEASTQHAQHKPTRRLDRRSARTERSDRARSCLCLLFAVCAVCLLGAQVQLVPAARWRRGTRGSRRSGPCCQRWLVWRR